MLTFKSYNLHERLRYIKFGLTSYFTHYMSFRRQPSQPISLDWKTEPEMHGVRSDVLKSLNCLHQLSTQIDISSTVTKNSNR